ncbi:MAG: peptidoglycan DD-metalloendopeptidase family protein [Prevotella sp.]|nr:peptidoglycan DD-metalloendopeptidase family protein [Prevotella sp.]
MKRSSFLRIVGIALLLTSSLSVQAQSVQQLKANRTKLESQISESKKLLATTNKDVKSQVNTLSVLSAQVKEQQALIDALDREVKAVSDTMIILEQHQRELEKELTMRKDSYARALRMATHRNTFENRLSFLFSAETFHQMYRRARYLREYSDFQAKEGREIQLKQEELAEKKKTLEQMHAEKAELLTKRQAEREVLAQKQSSQQAIVKQLQKKQANLKEEIARRQKEHDELDRRINKLIEEQIAASQKKKKEKTPKETPSGNTAKKETGSSSYKMSPEEVKLSGSFVNNKGRLPVPVVGPYLIVSHYGINQVEGMKDVKVNNQGVDIRSKDGATVRSIFSGEVAAVFEYDKRNFYGVLVRHGEYISVYCNLGDVAVRQGQKIQANTPLGTVRTDASGDCILKFQLRRNTQRLNPEEWVRF